jgi:putative membrane protein
MSAKREKHLLRGMLAGAAGGLAASWVMNEFQAGPGKSLTRALQSDAENQRQAKAAQTDEPQEDSTMKTAEALVHAVTGGRHLSMEEREKGGPIVHYAFGALMGAVYGGLAEYSNLVTAGFGTSFGAVLFGGGDLVAVPMLKLSGPPTEYPAASYANPFAAHIVYGVTTEIVRRGVRKLL